MNADARGFVRPVSIGAAGTWGGSTNDVVTGARRADLRPRSGAWSAPPTGRHGRRRQLPAGSPGTHHEYPGMPPGECVGRRYRSSCGPTTEPGRAPTDGAEAGSAQTADRGRGRPRPGPAAADPPRLVQALTLSRARNPRWQPSGPVHVRVDPDTWQGIQSMRPGRCTRRRRPTFFL